MKVRVFLLPEITGSKLQVGFVRQFFLYNVAEQYFRWEPAGKK